MCKPFHSPVGPHETGPCPLIYDGPGPIRQVGPGKSDKGSYAVKANRPNVAVTHQS